MLRATWHNKDQFKERYQRNNKFGGQKNLRCYPICSKGGHRDSGFCGTALTCTIHDLPPLEAGWEYRSFGEFIVCGTKELMRPNGTIPLEEAQSKERTASLPKLPWLSGDVRLQDGTEVSVSFNRQLGGWHYGWRANKHSCDSYHCFRAYIFKLKNDSDQLIYVGSVSSPVFQVYSRRRQRGVNKDGASQCDTASVTSKRTVTQAGLQSPTPVLASKQARMTPMSTFGSVAGSPEPDVPCPPKLGSGVNSGSSTPHDAPNASEHSSNAISSSNNNATSVPLRALASVAMDSKVLDTLMESFTSEYMKNRTLDRLTYFIFQYTSGSDVTWDDSDRTSNVTSEDLSHSGMLGLEMDVGEALNGPDFVDPHMWDKEPSSMNMSNGNQRNSTDADASDSGSSDKNINSGASGSSRSANAKKTKDIGEGMQHLREVLLRESSFANHTLRIDMILEGIEKISDCVIRLSKNNSAFNSVVSGFSSPEGLKRLKAQIEREREINFAWTPEREDRTWDPTKLNDPDHETSIFGMLRHQFRRIMSAAIAKTGQRLSPFIEPMDLAARFGVATPDPYYPPSPRAAAFIHMQLYGSLDNFEKQDYGSRQGKFINDEQQRQYAKDLMVVRRGIMRRIVCDRIVTDQRTRALFSERDREAPVSPGWDINGTWILVGPIEEDMCKQGNEALGALLSVCSGVNMGGFYNRVFTTMLSKIEVTITDETFTSSGQQMLLADPRLVANLKGKPHCWRPPMPMVVGYAGVQPLSQDKMIVGWLSVESDGTHCINVVIGGPLFSDAVSELACDTIRRRDGEPNTEAAQKLSLFFRKHVKPGDVPQVRVHKKFLISPSRQHLTMEDWYHIFPRAAVTPRMNDTTELATLNQECDVKFTGMKLRHRFMRCYLNQTDTDMILDLL
mmetsp:Transcript_16911/g.32998  ORF Transcript_16911/g.32998 Transcript_16911/m.32998 type:complete len:901 (-) Transcript_16911:113-2815(-)